MYFTIGKSHIICLNSGGDDGFKMKFNIASKPIAHFCVLPILVGFSCFSKHPSK